MNVKKLVDKFVENRSYLDTGAGKLGRQFKVPKEDIYKAKALARKTISKEMPDGLKLKSRWQNSGGQWLESYRMEEDKSAELKRFKDSFLSAIKNLSPVKPKYTESKPKGTLLEIALPDFHFGKIDGTTLKEQKELYIKAAIHMYELAKGSGIDQVLLPIGNDMLNSEATYTTTRGTPQRTNSTFYEMFRAAWEAIVSVVNYISEDVDVHIITIPGNHDENGALLIGEVISAYYHKNDDVTVEVSEKLTAYYRFGKNLFLYNHGDKIKPQDLPLRMAIERPKDFASCPYRFVRLGHLHKMTHDEVMGVEITRLPSLAKADKWHDDHGYLAKSKVTATSFDKIKGKTATYNVYLEYL